MELTILISVAVFTLFVSIIAFWRDDFLAFFFAAFLWLIIGINLASTGLALPSGEVTFITSISNNTYSNISELISGITETTETSTFSYTVNKSPIVVFIASLLIGFGIYCIYAGYEGVIEYRNMKIEE